jgi:hypothetical protein
LALRLAESGGKPADLQGVVEGLQEGAVGGVRECLFEGCLEPLKLGLESPGEINLHVWPLLSFF